MSNDRSPRDVCSITIGMRGLMAGAPSFSRFDWSFQTVARGSPYGLTVTPQAASRRLLATGDAQFRLCLRRFLVRCPDRLARTLLLERDPLHLRGDAVEGSGEPPALALRLVGAAFAQLPQHAVSVLEALADRLIDLLVGDLDPELVGDRLQHQLTGDGALRVRPKPSDEVVRGGAGDLQVRLERAAAAAEHLVEALEQRARARVDDGAVDAGVRGVDELVERGAAEALLHVRLDLGAQPLLDFGLEVHERVEFGRGLGEVVVERRQHLLLDLLHRRLDVAEAVVGELEADLARLAGGHADQLLLELRNEATRPELDDVVLL